MPLPLYTIGHSTHPLDEFVNLLTGHDVQLLADVRRFPSSQRYPHFNGKPLAAELARMGVEYEWILALGGRRGKQDIGESPNLALRNQSFRNYADYMLTAEFQASADELLEKSKATRICIMCSESVFWRCHRRLISDYALSLGREVQHIMPDGRLQPHSLTDGVSLAGGRLTYPLPTDPQSRLFE